MVSGVTPPQEDRPGPSRLAIIVALLSVLVLGIVVLRITSYRDRLGGHPNSVPNCDTPPGLR
jgi:hypothetical protein